jgi:hypothetical protein
VDERGFGRPDAGSGELPDVGAFEFQDASLSLALTSSSSSVATGGSVTFTMTVTNTSGNSLPADNSTVLVTLPAGLTATSPLSFTVGALGAGQTATFTATATGGSSGSQTVTAAVTSPDANPNSASSSTTVTVSPVATVVTFTSVLARYTLFSQVETVTAQVTSGGTPVTSGQVTFTDGGQTQTVGVSSAGVATATFTFSLFHEQPNAHLVTGDYSDDSTFGAGTGSTTAPATTLSYLFQFYFDYLLLMQFGL